MFIKYRISLKVRKLARLQGKSATVVEMLDRMPSCPQYLIDDLIRYRGEIEATRVHLNELLVVVDGGLPNAKT